MNLIGVQQVKFGKGGNEPQYSYTSGVGQNDSLHAGLDSWGPRLISRALCMGFAPSLHTLVFPCYYNSTNAAFSYLSLINNI